MFTLFQKLRKDELSRIIVDNIEDYIYREERYKSDFSLVAIYSKDRVNLDSLQDMLRKTDKCIYLSENLSCVVLDATSNESYIKAAENLNVILKNIDYKNIYFLSAVESKDFEENEVNMINHLFSRLEYALKNDLKNILVYQDYII